MTKKPMHKKMLTAIKRIINTCIGLALLTIACSIQAEARPSTEKPNVIIFFIDDSGYGDFAHNGNPTISTPTISRLAQEGVNCTQFYVSTAACSASRYSLLTGRYPGRSGLGSWVIGPESPRHIHDKEITLAEGLKSVGYKTGMFGKWHLGNPNKGNGMSADALPLAHGFDQWVGTNVSHDYPNAKLLKSDPSGDSPIKGYSTLAVNLPSNAPASKSLTGIYTKTAVQFIKDNKKKPFFAYIAHNQPHLGLFVGDEFEGKSRRGLLGDVMSEIDSSVDSVLKTLKECDIEKNTLIIFSSDNGPWVRFRDVENCKYGEARMHVGYALPFRDGKGSTWEGGHRVPGIFHWPGVIQPNHNQNPVSTLDILPTIFKICDVPIPTDRTLDGRDIRNLLSPELSTTKEKPFRFIYSYSDNRASAIRMGPWKLHIRIGSQTGNNYGFTASYQTPLLFQVEQDIGERINRAAEQPEQNNWLMSQLMSVEAQISKEGSFWE